MHADARLEKSLATRRSLRFLRKGRLVELSDFDPKTSLLDYLRLHEKSCGTKEGCAEGDCGACTVVLTRRLGQGLVYEPVNACILLLGQVEGTSILTIEDLASPEALHPVQQAMVEHHGSQCGFCTPGIIMSLFALYENAKRPVSRAMVETALAGNLCRCTGYRPIMDAALDACAEPSTRDTSPEIDRLDALLADGEETIFIGDEARFFASPSNIETLAALYLAHPDATLLAGATDIGLWITKQLRDLPKIIWLGRVSALAQVYETPKALTLGASVTHQAGLAALGQLHSDLYEIGRRFGSVQVRNSGTIGGNIANGSPIGDWAPCFIALGAWMRLQKGESIRALPLEAFFLDYGKQDRQAAEFVLDVTIPKLTTEQHFRAFKVSKRFDEDISAVMAAIFIELEGDRIKVARLAFGGMAGTPKRALGVEKALLGMSISKVQELQKATARVAEDFTPLSDARASAAYRLKLAQNLVLKALMEIGGTSPTLTRILQFGEGLHAAE